MRQSLYGSNHVRRNNQRSKSIKFRKLLLVLKSCGQDSYQYIYREATGVYWEKDLKGFVSTEPKKWSYSEWFSHIVDVAKQIGIELKLSPSTDWNGIPEKEKEQILKKHFV